MRVLSLPGSLVTGERFSWGLVIGTPPAAAAIVVGVRPPALLIRLVYVTASAISG